MKVILCTTPKGQFQLPFQKVAERTADYYACEIDGYGKNSPEWQAEFDWVMKDNFVAIHWLMNESNWDEWEDSVTKINDSIKNTEVDFWIRPYNFEIVDV